MPGKGLSEIVFVSRGEMLIEAGQGTLHSVSLVLYIIKIGL